MTVQKPCAMPWIWLLPLVVQMAGVRLVKTIGFPDPPAVAWMTVWDPIAIGVGAGLTTMVCGCVPLTTLTGVAW